MAYNYLREAETIHNSTLCFHDTNAGYKVNWYENGNLEGWETYSSVHSYGTWNNVLFGTSFGGDCYIGNPVEFTAVAAETYYVVKIQMKIVVADPDRSHITGGKIQWQTTSDVIWNDDKSIEFDVYTDDTWHLYEIIVGEKQYWQGNVRKLRLFPFLNSRKGDQFFIRTISITSPDTYVCTRQACSYFSQYEHPCPGSGDRGQCVARDPITSVDVVEGVNDTLIVNIDGYGAQPVNLLPRVAMTPHEIAKELEREITKIDLGGYTNAIVVADFYDKLEMYSGTFAADSSVVLTHTQLAEDLGFFDGATDVSTKSLGTDSATLFEFQSTYRLRGVEIFKLMDGNTASVAFYHNPDRYEVEAGRVDWQEKVTTELGTEAQYEDSHPDEKFDGEGQTLIDFTHPFNNSGLLKKVFLMGEMSDPEVGAKVKFFRPAKDGTVTLIHEQAFGTDNTSYIYSNVRDTYVVDVDYRARKGDLVGFYNVNLYLGDVVTGLPDAMYYNISGDATGTFTPGELIGHGNFGPNYYCRGNNRQDTVLLDIDFGKRVNIRSILFYGEEKSEDFEFNVAICDDINWTVDLKGGTHTHYVDDAYISDNSYTATHDNIAYGVDKLSDGITHTEDALAGTSYGMGGDGFFTSASTYFYVNGDAEWLNETPGENFGTPRYVADPPPNFERDPIEFNLGFRDEKTIHRTVLYFKDRRSFVNFYWAYFIDQYARHGNTSDNQYNYIPTYTKVSIDTVEFDYETADAFVQAYLFENPTSGDYQSYYNHDTGRTEVSNPEQAFASSILRWNILGHEFEPITTKAIRFYTDRHVSTKMMEIEAYSKVPNIASLFDDVYVTYSKEGGYWNGAVFESTTIEGEEVTNAMINDTPRYITLEIRSSSTISFNEFEILLDEHSVAIGDNKCLEELHLPESKTGKVNKDTSIKIWNTHEVEADLHVDIPYDYGDQKMILWTTLENDEAVELPEIGPGGTYYKNVDYPILNDDYQAAINCPCWGLKNLAGGKEVYYNHNDTEWLNWGTYTADVELNIAHPNKRITEFEFTPTSATYFKIIPLGPTGLTNISQIIAYNDDAQVNYPYGWDLADLTPTTPFTNAVTTFNDGDMTTGTSDLVNNYGIIDDFDGVAIDSTIWPLVYNSSYLSVTGGWLVGNVPPGQISYIRSYSGSSSYDWFFPGDFIITISYEVLNWTMPSANTHYLQLYAYGVSGSTANSITIRREWYQPDGSPNGNKFYTTIRTNASNTSRNDYNYTPTSGQMQIKRVGNTLQARFWDSISGWDPWLSRGGNSESEGFYVQVSFVTGGSGNPIHKVDWVATEISESNECVGISFDSHTAIDKLKLFHDTTDYVKGFEIYTSYDNITYNLWDTVQDVYGNLITVNEEFETYIAFDLEKRHALDFIRHYGEDSDDFDITDYKLYFNNDTSDPNDLEPSGELIEWTYQGTSYGAAYHVGGGDPHGDFGTHRDGTGLMYGSSARFRSVLKFDPIFTLPTDVDHIVAYNLELYIDARYGNNTNTEVHLLLYECLVDWPEDESINYGSPTPGVHIGTTVVGEVIYPDVFSNWPIYPAEIALNQFGRDLVDDWISGAKDNYGWYIMEKHDYVNEDVYPIESRVGWYNETHGASSLHPRIRILYRSSDVNTGSIDDCRWPIIVVPEGKEVKKIGIYPNVSYADAPGGGYNSEWDDLGTRLTDYNAKTNIAYDTTVSGSSTFFDFTPGFVVDGVIPDEEVTKCWGTDDSATQWLKIYLDDLSTIDEVRCYWGYHTGDDRFLVTDYTISTSLDDVAYTDVVDITGNTEFTRHHVFDSPVQARYVLIDINGYDAGTMSVRTDLGTYEDFSGALVREIEVLEALPISYVEHNEYPVVCVDLSTRFNITDHDITSPYPDFTDSYWDNDNSNFRFSNSLFDEPEKIEFTGYGASLPRDAKWVLIKNDDPILGGPETFSTDFSEYTLYSPPSDWYAHYPPGGYTWEITDATANPLPTSDRTMLVDVGNDDYRFIWNLVPQEAEVEVLGLVLTATEGTNGSPAIIARGSNTWDLGQQQGFWSHVGPNNDYVYLNRYIPGNFYGDSWSVSGGVDGESWYWVRMRLEGTTQYVKAWKYGDTEPVSWDGTDTVAEPTDAGWVGVYHDTNYWNAYYAWFSVGIRGFSAPHPDDPVVSEIEERINDGYNFLDNLLVYSSEKDHIHEYPWWWSSRFSTLSSDYSIHSPETIQSLKIEYTGGVTTSGIEELYFIEGASFGTDELFSERDRLGFNLYIDDISNLNTTYGEISFGDIQGLRYHTWDFSTIASELSTGWNEVKLKFSAAETQITNYGEDSPADNVFNDLNNYNDLNLKSFKFKFRGKGDPLTLYIDDIKIDRTRFEDTVKFGQGLYLCNTEYLSFPLSEFDPRKGSLEFYLRPDYSFAGADTFRQIISRTWFCFTNVANDIFGVFLSPPRGPSIVVGNSNNVVVIRPSVTPTDDRYFSIDDVTHIGFVWSYDGTQIDSHGTTAALFINGTTIGTTNEMWEVRDSKSSRLLIGGTLSQKAANRGTTSLWGVIDNLKVYNYCKSDFADRNVEGYDTVDVLSPNSFLEISKDGVNFYDRNSAQLPLEFENVPSGESRVVWVRTNIPADLTGNEQRTAQLIVEAIRSF